MVYPEAIFRHTALGASDNYCYNIHYEVSVSVYFFLFQTTFVVDEVKQIIQEVS